MIRRDQIADAQPSPPDTPLVDRHGRRIRYLRLSVTDRCNLRCRYCMPLGGEDHVPHTMVLSYEEMLRIIGICTGRGVRKVRITGGEPLTRKGIVQFIERLSALGGVRDVSLTTNGVLLAGMAGDLKKAGLQRVNVSLDTLDRAKFSHITRVDAFNDVIRGICAAYEHGLHPVKINVVAIRGFNDCEIEDFARLTLRLPVEVRFIELMPVGCITKYPENEHISGREIRERIEERFGELHRLEGGLGPASMYRIPGAEGLVGIIGALSEHEFCVSCNRIRITARGRLRTCLFSEDELDLLGPMRNGVTDGELERLIEDGVRMKPPAHGVCRGAAHVHGGLLRTGMSRIGG